MNRVAAKLSLSAQCQGMVRAMLAYDPGQRLSAEELLQHPVDLVRLRDRMAPTLRQRIESEGLKA